MQWLARSRLEGNVTANLTADRTTATDPGTREACRSNWHRDDGGGESVTATLLRHGHLRYHSSGCKSLFHSGFGDHDRRRRRTAAGNGDDKGPFLVLALWTATGDWCYFAAGGSS